MGVFHIGTVSTDVAKLRDSHRSGIYEESIFSDSLHPPGCVAVKLNNKSMSENPRRAPEFRDQNRRASSIQFNCIHTQRERDALTLTELGSLKFLVCPINTGYSNHVADALRPPSPVPNS